MVTVFEGGSVNVGVGLCGVGGQTMRGELSSIETEDALTENEEREEDVGRSWYVVVGVGDGGGEGGALISISCIRRSTIKLALRIDTAGSRGRRCIGTETRSEGPIGCVGVFMRYRMMGARCFVD